MLKDHLAATPVLMVLDGISEAVIPALPPFFGQRPKGSLALAIASDQSVITLLSRVLAIEHPGEPFFAEKPLSMDEDAELKWQQHAAVAMPILPPSLFPATAASGVGVLSRLCKCAQQVRAGLASMSCPDLWFWLFIWCCGCVSLGVSAAGWKDAKKWSRVGLCVVGSAGVLTPVRALFDAGKGRLLEARVRALEDRPEV